MGTQASNPKRPLHRLRIMREVFIGVRLYCRHPSTLSKRHAASLSSAGLADSDIDRACWQVERLHAGEPARCGVLQVLKHSPKSAGLANLLPLLAVPNPADGLKVLLTEHPIVVAEQRGTLELAHLAGQHRACRNEVATVPAAQL